ncbi:D-2-hydroxyacid dehydrogenase [Natronobacterium gregoryi]|uniref:D-2-hydroxyacid dehydrogenase n=2 Tax=Natronobacterium gregoryi TaxID=44930 RepID=L0AID1_NATGS|nr:D-2-hydroxyacid dehydrogenase [Natronobacterium gregoryi]AFZ73628.1 phosphoglycerate dehydrogenase-like oxidoreductase [Natronobacterium gregoryi SP2]ELY67911.1 phosphoglycerate dehydrogenase [Natronobacterium gregoryi SP2]PLK19983.1 D-2-hydroxyacid dehydrogenase [Natronobacterium gregoryi SP2]SFJ34015.1 Phosphoglycerate dehydrogenase [Natronobacterium gregoryi]
MSQPDVAVLREGTEGLSMGPYAKALRERLPDHTVSLARTPREERELTATARVVTGTGIDEDLLAVATRLELFACAFSGTEHLPKAELADRGVIVTNAGGVHAPGIAEQAIGNMLAFARRLHEGWRRTERNEWRHFQSTEFTGSTVTIVGLGSIGQAIAQRLEGFEVETIGVRYTPEKGGPTDEVVGLETGTIHDAFARSEYVVLACPLTDETRRLVDGEAFATLPPEAVLVNVARGGIVDTDALVDALQRNAIRGAALDVTDPEPLPPEHPLWDLGNCFITPHTGGHTPNHWDRLADVVAHNVEALEHGGDLENVVLTPDR